MATMTRWDAFHDLRRAQEHMSGTNYMYQLLAQARGQDAVQSGLAETSAPAWAPAVDISERKDAYVLSVELPGIKIEDLDIEFQDGLLTIQGQRTLIQDSADEQFHVMERRYGFFRRSFTLPRHVEADAIVASSEDGVLQVVIPKVEEVKPKRIDVRAVPTLAPTADGPAGMGVSTTEGGEEPADRDSEDRAEPVLS